ncbi:MAG: hypothetical protein EZS28_013016 [Streblomastix strix]|uniref:Uncharacterized protein n=1 Tax=Streblomastix strix TaxID=222440 RepID=A0A5J4W968_9EUKA|nr:MAG: hypothetical protein EZS28_013016 [Streblomastix strix]
MEAGETAWVVQNPEEPLCLRTTQPILDPQHQTRCSESVDELNTFEDQSTSTSQDSDEVQELLFNPTHLKGSSIPINNGGLQNGWVVLNAAKSALKRWALNSR